MRSYNLSTAGKQSNFGPKILATSKA